MNKKTTVADVARIFPNATIEEHDDAIFLPLHTEAPSLRLILPEVLPLGAHATGVLPGDFHASNTKLVCQDLGTEFPIWVAAGSYHENGENDPEFHFKDWLTAETLLIVSRWELTPPLQVAAGMDSPFARNYKAMALMRISPPEMLGLNQVLPHIPVELSPVFSKQTGLDFWVVERTDFYAAECQLLSDNLRQTIQIGERERYSDTTHAVCRQMMEKLAADIADDARFTAKDRRGTICEMTIFYTPAYVVGAQRYIEQGREGTLTF